jgi:hypothetical protein
MTPEEAVAFVAGRGIVLESGRGPVPNLAETIAGNVIRGSWWTHPKANVIFLCSRAIRSSADVLVCRLVAGKVTYVHRRLWPALVRLAPRFDSDRLAAIKEVHTSSGKHALNVKRFPTWVTDDVAQAAARLTEEEASCLLPLGLLTGRATRNARRKQASWCLRFVVPPQENAMTRISRRRHDYLAGRDEEPAQDSPQWHRRSGAPPTKLLVR